MQTAKQEALNTIDQLPDDADIGEIISQRLESFNFNTVF